MNKKQQKQLDEQLAYWETTDAEHRARQEMQQQRRDNCPLCQAAQRREDAWADWYMKNINIR